MACLGLLNEAFQTLRCHLIEAKSTVSRSVQEWPHRRAQVSTCVGACVGPSKPTACSGSATDSRLWPRGAQQIALDASTSTGASRSASNPAPRTPVMERQGRRDWCAMGALATLPRARVRQRDPCPEVAAVACLVRPPRMVQRCLLNERLCRQREPERPRVRCPPKSLRSSTWP